eukprot:ANDGO_06359.mRNA.1 hypothetical protein
MQHFNMQHCLTLSVLLLAAVACGRAKSDAEFRLGRFFAAPSKNGELSTAVFCDPYRDRALVPFRDAKNNVVLTRSLPGNPFSILSANGQFLPEESIYGRVILWEQDPFQPCIVYVASGPDAQKQYSLSQVNACDNLVVHSINLAYQQPIHLHADGPLGKLFVDLRQPGLFNLHHVHFVSLSSFSLALSVHFFQTRTDAPETVAFLISDGQFVYTLQYYDFVSDSDPRTAFEMARIDPGSMAAVRRFGFGSVPGPAVYIHHPAVDSSTNQVWFYVARKIIQFDFGLMQLLGEIALETEITADFRPILLALTLSKETLHLVGSGVVVTLIRTCVDDEYWIPFVVENVQTVFFQGQKASVIAACAFPETDDLVMTLVGASVNAVVQYRRLPSEVSPVVDYPAGLRGFSKITSLALDPVNQVGFFLLGDAQRLVSVDLLRMELLADIGFPGSFVRVLRSAFDTVQNRLYLLTQEQGANPVESVVRLRGVDSDTLQFEDDWEVSADPGLSADATILVNLFTVDSADQKAYIGYRHTYPGGDPLAFRSAYCMIDFANSQQWSRDENNDQGTLPRLHATGLVINSSLVYFVEWFLSDATYRPTIAWRNPSDTDWFAEHIILSEIDGYMSVAAGGLPTSPEIPQSDLAFAFYDELSGIAYLPMFNGYLRILVSTNEVLDSYYVDPSTGFTVFTAPPLVPIYPQSWPVAFPLNSVFVAPPSVFLPLQQRVFHVVKSNTYRAVSDAILGTEQVVHDEYSELAFGESLLIDEVLEKLYVVGVRNGFPTVWKVYLAEGDDDVLDTDVSTVNTSSEAAGHVSSNGLFLILSIAILQLFM